MATPAGQKNTIEITDNGDGICNLSQVFSGNSTKGTGGETGTGVGLSLCDDFIKKLGGGMAIESTTRNKGNGELETWILKENGTLEKKEEPNTKTGTTFTITLPKFPPKENA